MSDFLIFLVEDDRAQSRMLQEVFEGECVLEVFASAEQCAARVSEQKPDMFLLDVGLPGKDGYTFCRELKADFETDAIPVTFISGGDTLDARLAGYDAGGDDFIPKPYTPSEVLHKVRTTRRVLIEKRELAERAGYAQTAAFTAMSSMSELGVVLEFMRRSYSCVSPDALANALLAALNDYQLSSAVRLKIGDEIRCFSPHGVNVPLECSILNHVSTLGRIFEFSQRCVFNYGSVTLLVNNMPLDDRDRYGRLRDHLATLAEGADARLSAILIEQENLRRAAGIGSAVTTIREELQASRSAREMTRAEVLKSAFALNDELEMSFLSLGLTEAQEYFLLNLVGRHVQAMALRIESDRGGESRLEDLANALSLLTSSVAAAPPEPEPRPGSSDAFEMF